MSMWTHIMGTVVVEPFGASQRAKEFVLGEVVDSLPLVSGNEGPMHVEIVREDGFDCSSNGDGFGRRSNLGTDIYGNSGGMWFKTQSTYDLLLTANLRDRVFDETLREFVKWMNRLSKRVLVKDMLVRLWGFGRSKVFDGAGHWRENYVSPRLWGERDAGERRYANWRYGIAPKPSDWTGILVNLVPGGGQLSRDFDFATGNLEWYEYGQSVEEVDGSLREVDELSVKVERLRCALFELRAELALDEETSS